MQKKATNSTSSMSRWRTAWRRRCCMRWNFVAGVASRSRSREKAAMKCCLMTMGLLGLAVSGVLAQEKKAVPPPPKPAPDGAAAAKSAKPLTLKTQKEKFSYAIGMKMGENFNKQSISVDPAILARGLKDSLAPGKTLLTDDEAQDVIKEMQAEAQKNQEQKKQAQGTANQEEGDAFLAANQGKEGVVTLPSGLQYKVLIEG